MKKLAPKVKWYLGLIFLLFLLPADKLAAAEEGRQVFIREKPQAKTSSAEKRWALLVGIDKYEEADITPLNFSVSDVRQIYRILIDPKIGGFEKENVVLLSSDASEEYLKPTRNNILAKLNNFLCALPSENDLVLIYFCGHGIEENGKSYLLPVDATMDLLEDSAISLERVNQILNRIPSKRQVVVLDSCHSGSLGRSGPSKMGDDFEKFLSSGEGRVTLSSCKANEVSYEWSEEKHGVFTYFLAEGLKGKADENHDGCITVTDLHNYTWDKVRRWAAVRNKKQTPTMQSNVAGDIALVAFAEPTPIPTPQPSPSPTSVPTPFVVITPPPASKLVILPLSASPQVTHASVAYISQPEKLSGEAMEETLTVPAQAPYSVALQHGFFLISESVVVTLKGRTFKYEKISGEPGTFQYSLSSLGVLTLSEAEAGKELVVRYRYRPEKVALFPLQNRSKDPKASEIVGARLSDFLSFLGCRVVSAPAELVGEQAVSSGEEPLPEKLVQKIRETAGAESILTGEVLEYDKKINLVDFMIVGPFAPKRLSVKLALRLYEAKDGKLIWKGVFPGEKDEKVLAALEGKKKPQDDMERIVRELFSSYLGQKASEGEKR